MTYNLNYDSKVVQGLTFSGDYFFAILQSDSVSAFAVSVYHIFESYPILYVTIVPSISSDCNYGMLHFLCNENSGCKWMEYFLDL